MSEEAVVEQTEAEAAASLSAGYNKVSPQPDEPEAPKVEAPKVEAPKVEAPKVEASVADPWEGVSLVVRSALEGINAKLGGIDGLANDFKATKGRVAAIQSEMAASKAKAEAAAQAAADNPASQALVDEAAATLAKWKEQQEEWPDLAAGLDERITARIAESLKQSVDVDGIKRAVSNNFNQSLAQVRQEAIREARKLAPVDLKHPTWEDDIFADAPNKVLKPEFAAWSQAQPPEVQALAQSDKPADAIKMLDLYYDHRKLAERREKNQTRLQTAVAPKQAASGGPTILPDDAGLSVGYNRVRRA